VLLGQNGDFAHGRGAHVCQAVVSLQVFQDGYGLGFGRSWGENLVKWWENGLR